MRGKERMVFVVGGNHVEIGFIGEVEVSWGFWVGK